MSTATVDYDALAKQHGGAAAVDYDSLAAQHGGKASAQPSQAQEPDDGAIWHAVKSAGGDLAEAAKGLYHTATDAPETAGDKAALAIGGPLGVPLKRMVHGYFKTVQDSIDKAKKSAEEGDMTGVMFHSAAAGLPLVGPLTERVYDKAKSGDTSGAVGVGASRIAQLMSMAPEKSVIPNPTTAIVDTAAKGVNAGLKAAEPAASRLYQSALKPPPSTPAAEVRTIVNTGLKEGIPVSEAGMAKISALVDGLNNEVKAKIAAGAKAGQTIDPAAVASRVDQARGKFAKQVNPRADLAALDASKQEFLENNSTPSATGIGPANVKPIPVDEAQAIKQGTYRQMSAKAYGEMGTATTEAQKALARGIKEELEIQFPEIKGLNAREGKMLDLDEVLQRAVNREANKVVLPLGGPIAGGAIAAATGSGPAGAAAFVLKAVLDHPSAKSRIAIAISKGSKVSMNTAYTKLAAYSAALANAVSSQDRDGQASEQKQ